MKLQVWFSLCSNYLHLALRSLIQASEYRLNVDYKLGGNISFGFADPRYLESTSDRSRRFTIDKYHQLSQYELSSPILGNNMALHCLIMAGGQGTRFWPVSTKQRPKQYMNILGGLLLTSRLSKRITPVSEVLHRHIVTVEAQRSLAEEQGGEFLPKENLIFEPSGRNTAPCIYLSLVSLLEKGASLLMTVSQYSQVIMLFWTRKVFSQT